MVLDPVSSGKAMYHFITNLSEAEPESFSTQTSPLFTEEELWVCSTKEMK
jgi:hypothetical protein